MNTLEQIWNRIKRSEKVCFFSAFIWGLLTHMYMFTNKLPNWDDLGNFDTYGVGGELGRWMLRPLDFFTVKYSNPWVNGTVTILLVALACVVIYKILDFESTAAAVLVPMIVMTFPSLASTMAFMFTVDLYAFGLLLAVLAAYMVTRKNKWLKLLAIVPMVISMGLYQAYICFTITLLLVVVIKALLDTTETPCDEEKKWHIAEITKSQFINGVIYAVFLAVSTGAYIIMSHLRYPGINNEVEHNVGSMGNIGITRIPKLIAKAYLRFFRYFLLGDYSFMTRAHQIFNIIVVVLLAVFWVMLLVKIKKDKLRLLFTILVTGLLPLGNSFVDIMAPDAAFSMLMLYQFCLVYVVLLYLVERLWKKDSKMVIKCLSAVAVLVVCCIVYKQYTLTGEAYFRMDIAYKRSQAFLQRVIVHVEEQDGYVDGDPIRILGNFDGNYSKFQRMGGAKTYRDFSGIALEYGMMTPGAREWFASIYLGIDLEPAYGEEADAIINSEAYKEMDYYPSGECIKQIDGCWIVKLED